MSGIWDALGRVVNEGVYAVKRGIEEYEKEIRSINTGIFVHNIITIGTIALGILGILGAGPEFIITSILGFLVRFHINDALTARINAVVKLADSFGVKEAIHGGDPHLGVLIRPMNIY